MVLTDLGTRLKLEGSVQEGITKYYDAVTVDPRYAVRAFGIIGCVSPLTSS